MNAIKEKIRESITRSLEFMNIDEIIESQFENVDFDYLVEEAIAERLVHLDFSALVKDYIMEEIEDAVSDFEFEETIANMIEERLGDML